MTPSFIPEGYTALTPYLIVDNAAKALDFYKNVFGGEERMRMEAPDGTVGHAEMCINGSLLMLASSSSCSEALSPQSYGGSPVTIHLYVENADHVVDKALLNGATLVSAVETKFYGDRSGTLRDPFGHTWHVATRVENISPQEMSQRAQAFALS